MIKISKVFNKFDLLSPELENSANQRLIVRTDKPFDPEDSTFWVQVGPEKGFDKKEQYVQLTTDEARQLWQFLGKFFQPEP